jgi:hypothetical protein
VSAHFAEPVLEHPPPRFLARRLPERTSIEACPHRGAMPGDLRCFDRVDAAPTGERAEASAQVVRGRPLKAGGHGRLLDRPREIPKRERLAGSGYEDEIRLWPRSAVSSRSSSSASASSTAGNIGTSRSLAFVFNGTSRAGRSLRAGSSCERTRSSPSTKPTSAQRRRRTSEIRRPV